VSIAFAADTVLHAKHIFELKSYATYRHKNSIKGVEQMDHSYTSPNRTSRNDMFTDSGPNPFVINIDRAARINKNYRTTLWTGNHLQLTLMSIRVGGDIGLEVHPHLDQFIRIEQGLGLVKMGNNKDDLSFQKRVNGNYAFIIPAGTWHNLINIGNVPIKLYSIYAPPQHPKGTIHKTKADAMAEEE
jgi:mannose-6-phosphate isomerase-like protein (cupin superfamily)